MDRVTYKIPPCDSVAVIITSIISAKRMNTSIIITKVINIITTMIITIIISTGWLYLSGKVRLGHWRPGQLRDLQIVRLTDDCFPDCSIDWRLFSRLLNCNPTNTSSALTTWFRGLTLHVHPNHKPNIPKVQCHMYSASVPIRKSIWQNLYRWEFQHNRCISSKITFRATLAWFQKKEQYWESLATFHLNIKPI